MRPSCSGIPLTKTMPPVLTDVRALSWVLVCLLGVLMGPAQGREMEAFPAPVQGQQRFVLHLPQRSDEALFRVELQVGKTVLLDRHNRYFFGGEIRRETIAGWGYQRYVVSQLGPMGGTLMAVPPNTPKVERFIGLGGEPFIVRYNSRLPIVVYAPEDAEVRYRIWSTGPALTPIGSG